MDPFVFFVDTIKGKLKNVEVHHCHHHHHHFCCCCLSDVPAFQINLPVVMQSSDPLRFENLTQTLELNYQTLANGVAQHAEQRRAEIEGKIEKPSAATAS